MVKGSAQLGKNESNRNKWITFLKIVR